MSSAILSDSSTETIIDPLGFDVTACSCGGKTEVIDSRPSTKYWRRRRRCPDCGARNTTAEIYATELHRLLAIDNRLEEFSASVHKRMGETGTVSEVVLESIKQDFWSRVAVDFDATQCWPYTKFNGELCDTYGYFRFRGQMVRSHRFAYTLAFGEIDEGLIIRHRCNNPPCCNPGHLEIGTDADNALDRVANISY